MTKKEKGANAAPDTPVAAGTAAKANREPRPDSRKQTGPVIIYMGPSIRGVAAYGTVYNNGIPDALGEKIREIPVIAQLLVPVEAASQAMADRADGSTAFGACYEKTLAELRKQMKTENGKGGLQ